jgi:hypothetical protein
LSHREKKAWREAESIEWFTEDQALTQSYAFAPPLPPLPSVSSTGNTQEDWEFRRDNLLTGDGEGGGGGGAKSDDREKDWSSINHSILSASLLAFFSLCDR